jgi:hypothetical protein
MLLSRLGQENRLVVAAAAAVLLALVVASYAPRIRQVTVERRDRARLLHPAQAGTGASGHGS